MAKPKPITAYPMAKGVREAGINIVNSPREKAQINITRPIKRRPAALLFNFEFCHIFPAKAISVMAIIRIDQVNCSLTANPSNSKNKSGAISKKRAERLKTIEPAFKVCLTPCWYIP